MTYLAELERWGTQEIAFDGPSDGCPFTEQTVSGCFESGAERVEVNGFYDGEGRYIVRFMPSFEGTYRFSVTASFLTEPLTGSFTVGPAAEGVHGPVRVSGYHLVYEDGTPYWSVGTTCYVWALQSDKLIAQTLESLKVSGFNKIRFCVFPKHYVYNLHEPRSYPYEGTPMDSSVLTVDNFNDYHGACEGNDWQFDRFRPDHFRHLEKCILALRDLGIEADIIMMHPYDRWGFSCMTAEQDDLYWHYAIARFSAYRNVWWSLANEYDLLTAKTIADWERYAGFLCSEDKYHHMRSIHSCRTYYDYSRPWITHCSMQRTDLYKTAEMTDEWRRRYGKPVVLDEIAYEGNIQHGWGNITGEEMVRRFWEGAMRGGYPGHGETFLNEEGVLWWSHGGPLRGESWKRVRFLLQILKETPGEGLRFMGNEWDAVCAEPEDRHLARETGYRICYYSFMRPSFREFSLDPDTDYQVEVIDTWNMTVERLGVFRGRFRVPLPGRQYMAIRLRKA